MTDLRRGVVLLVCLGLGVPGIAQAQTPTTVASPDVQQVRDELARLKKEFDDLRQQYGERLLALEQKLGQLGGGPNVVEITKSPESPKSPEGPASPEPPQAPAAQPQPGAGASKVFNPDTSVIANFVGAAGKNPFSSQPSMQLSEAEVSFQAVIDPYARADFFLSASPSGLNVEEGFMTFTSLPGGLLLKAGKMRASFGKVNTLHTHALPTADRPLVTENLVGGEDGISDAGMSLSKLIQNPALFLEVTGEVFAGSSDVFQTTQRSKLSYVGHVRGYRDLTEATNIDLGASVAYGPSTAGFTGQPIGPVPTLNRRLIGVDGTFRYRPLRRAIYQRLNVRSEVVWSRLDLPVGLPSNAFGYYVLGEYQFARRWYIGARGDRAGQLLDGTMHDKGASVFLTYWPSEFSQIRGQYRRTNYAGAPNLVANEFLFQFNFSIGAHGAHVF